MKILITGGAGFIGSNLAARGLKLGQEITILDNLSRPGSLQNLDWVNHIGPIKFYEGEVWNPFVYQNLFDKNSFDVVFHEAAQTAVTTSIEDPIRDFQINAFGTQLLLEMLRFYKQNPVFIYASTNKVYGSLDHLRTPVETWYYSLQDYPYGIPESFPLSFCSPYGCSKGAADQYVRDYRRTYGLRTIVFRQSCIYGPRQNGMEDQGWVAYFAQQALQNKPITIYGNGFQVRDLLYIDDLVDLYYQAINAEPGLEQFVFNVGGGPDYARSLVEVLDQLPKTPLKFAEPRLGDQKVYVSDIRLTKQSFQWQPRVSPEVGINSLVRWIKERV